MRHDRIQLHFVSIRTPWLPPFVLCVCTNLMSAALSIAKRGRRISQAARKLIKCRRISIDCTISRISSPAWEVRVSVAPDFRLHPSSEFGSLHPCQLGQTIWLRTDPSKNPFSQTHINPTNRLPQYKVLCTAFFQESAFPIP